MSSVVALTRVVLLLTPVDMSRTSAGQIYLKRLIETTPSIRVVCERLPSRGHLEYLSAASFISRAITSMVSRFGSLQSFYLSHYERAQLSHDVRVATELAKHHGVESVWITLSSPECILLALALNRQGLKLRVTIWDTPEHLLTSQHINSRVSTRVMQRFGEVMGSALSVSVIGLNMQERYSQQYRIAPIVLRPLPGPTLVTPRATRHRGSLRLFFAGSLYAKAEWNALLDALEARNWRVSGRRVVIYFLGAFPLRGAASHRRVKRLGFRTQAGVMAIGGSCDIAYLPYWLSPDHALAASTSFPSKLSDYLSSGLPILNHGPSSSELTRLMRTHAVGVSCHTRSADDIVAALERLADLARRKVTSAAINYLLATELSAGTARERFAEFIDLQPPHP
jgi:hypothetical protein